MNMFESAFEKQQRENAQAKPKRKRHSDAELEAEIARLKRIIAKHERAQHIAPRDDGLLRSGAHDTEVAAAKMQVGNVGTKRRKVYEYIKEQGARGSTDDEVMVNLDFSHSNATARRGELARGLFVVDSGNRRKTRTGAQAIVWVLPEHRDGADV